MPPRSLEREGRAPPPPGTAEEEGAGWRGRGWATTAVLRASRTARSIWNHRNKTRGRLPPSQAWSPAQQGPGRRHKEHGKARPVSCWAGLALPLIHYLLGFAQTILFEQSVSGESRAHLDLRPGLCPCGGRFLLRLQRQLQRGTGALPGASAQPAAPQPWPPGGNGMEARSPASWLL